MRPSFLAASRVEYFAFTIEAYIRLRSERQTVGKVKRRGAASEGLSTLVLDLDWPASDSRDGLRADVDGVFGRETESAVRCFQGEHGLRWQR